jgi:ubiquinone/menaquinone biosynthesis C-methylase UbiE
LRKRNRLLEFHKRFYTGCLMPGETDKWKKEFDTESRSRTYDKVIDLFSLRRAERFKVLLNLLPEPSAAEFNILELGTGTGVVTELLLERYPHASIVTVEGAARMIEQAEIKTSFQKNKKRLQLIHADYSAPSWSSGINPSFNLIITFDSLHHLSHQRKKELYREIYDLLIQDGDFLISDHIISQGLFFDDFQYDLWIQEILDNLKSVKKGSDIASALEDISSWTYNDVQDLSPPKLKEIFTSNLKQEGDNPMPIMEHIDIMRNIGFAHVIVEYRFANFAIISAKKR